MKQARKHFHCSTKGWSLQLDRGIFSVLPTTGTGRSGRLDFTRKNTIGSKDLRDCLLGGG